MSERYFYRVDGSRVRVPQREWERRTKLQDAAIARSGRQVWRTRRNRVKSVTTSEHKQLSAKREIAKRASRIGWDVVRSIKEASARPLVRRYREFTGPSATIRSRAEYGAFRGLLYDFVAAAIAADARGGRQLVQVELNSVVLTPDGPEPGGSTRMPFAVAIDGKIVSSVRKKKDFFKASVPLFDGVRGLVIYPGREPEDGEIAVGEIVKGPRPAEFDSGAVAEQGYSAYVTSAIFIR